MSATPNSYRTGPDSAGHFGAYGGRFVAETLMPLVLSLETAYEAAKKDPALLAAAFAGYRSREALLHAPDTNEAGSLS